MRIYIKDQGIHLLFRQTGFDYPNFHHAYKLIDLKLKTELFYVLIKSFLYFFHFMTHTHELGIRASYWKNFSYFHQSVISSLIWYIQVSLVHCGHLPGYVSLDDVKSHLPLVPFLLREAERLFKLHYQSNLSNKVIVRNCRDYPQLNDKRGQIQFDNEHNQHYLVVFESNIPNGTFAVHINSRYLELVYKIKKLGVTTPCQNQVDTVTVPNLFCCDNMTLSNISIKFHLKLFELMRSRYVRPEKALVVNATNALSAELLKLDNENKSHLFIPFKMPFQTFVGSTCQSGNGLYIFQLSDDVSDDNLETIFSEEGSIEISEATFETLRQDNTVHPSIIDFCMKW